MTVTIISPITFTDLLYLLETTASHSDAPLRNNNFSYWLTSNRRKNLLMNESITMH